MNGFELNKIAAAVLLAGLIAMVVATIADTLYRPQTEGYERGYAIDVPEESAAPGAVAAVDPYDIDIAPYVVAGDVARGEVAAKKCAACHTFTKGGANMVGPGLWDIMGHDIAAHAGYNYSSVLNAMEGSWDYQKMAQFIARPSKFAPGTKMSFAGIRDPQERGHILAYLRTLSDNPKALPVVKDPSPTPEAAEPAPAGTETPPTADAP